MKHNHKKFINQLIFSMMTKKILGLIFLFSVISATKTTEAQTYRPMLQDSVRWIVIRSDWYNPDRWEYFALGDTLVDNILYKKIYHRFLEPEYGMLPPYEPVSPYVLHGLMREDTLTRQVFGIRLNAKYFNGCPIGMEALMYDFSVNVGDTINHFCIILQMCGEVNIHSTGQSNVFGIYTRWFEVASGCSWGRLYEGIGSSYGLWEAMFTPVKSQYLSYTFLEYYCPDAVCPFIVGTKELKANDRSLKVYPNPATTETWLQLPENIVLENARVELYSSSGRQLYKAQPTSYFHKIETANLPKGLYLVRLWDGERWMVEKLVVR
ncbi:MAG: T9SS type A sorting domain-containing protein [Ignavibacteria bacterium]|nr:T9SS type A sorting domain-containing protein [Ignavibacteria bacterium]